MVGICPHQKPSLCRWFHSNAWQPRNIKPPIIVPIIHQTTSFLALRWPASTANTIVTELKISISVIKPTKTKGAPCSTDVPGMDWNTKDGDGQVGALKRKEP